MDPELLALLANAPTRIEDRHGLRAAMYRTIAARVGASFRCLDPEVDDAPAPTAVENDDGAVQVRIQGPLDWFWGFDVRALIADLDAAEPNSIHLLIESPGGFLSDGLALYADLRARLRGGVTVTAEARGVVASATVLPFLAADERGISTGTQLMVHDPWSWSFEIGTVAEMRAQVEKTFVALEAGEKTLRGVMVERTGKSRQQVSAWLKAETWFSPDEAVEAGYATAVIEDTSAGQVEQDAQARALARRTLANWRLNLRKEAA